MKFYEDDFEKATKWFEKDAGAFLRAGYAKGRPDGVGKPSALSGVKEAGGWFGGFVSQCLEVFGSLTMWPGSRPRIRNGSIFLLQRPSTSPRKCTMLLWRPWSELASGAL